MATKSYTTIHSGYKLSPCTFEKHSRTAAEHYTHSCGDVWFNTRHWKTDRIANEAKALKLLAERTRIPIPQFIQCGQNDDRSMFLEMNRVDGIDLSEVSKECQKPGGVRHNDGGECNKCKNIAKANVEHFIQTVLLPELAKLRSNKTGLDGFVLPPAWMLEYDTRLRWDVNASSYEEFVFTHGDVGPDNLRMDPYTLTVKLPEYPEGCYEFLIEGFAGVFGHLIEPTVKSFSWNKHWAVDHDKKTVKLLGDSFETRRSGLEETLVHERDIGTFNVLKRWTEKRFPIYGPDRELVADIERSAAGLFGIVTYGVQLITYCENEDGISIWAARRAVNKALYPNKLGVTVGGSLPAKETPFECLVREAQEEASLPSSLLTKAANSVGILTYVMASDVKSAKGSEPGLIRAEV
ncbi:hypothetical protein IFR05_016866 [Cadophora sp. M221]|nr:hypothetical protein IFR05_016866 [Cadophora sp. M221]